MENMTESNPKTYRFYVVSPTKFLILYLGTLGLYGSYWFYKHYSLYLESSDEEITPILGKIMSVMIGAVISILFVHLIFKLFEKQAKNIGEYTNSLSIFATIYVIFFITAKAGDHFIKDYSSSALLLSLFITGWSLYNAQKVANIACEDIEGTTNNKLTSLNYGWLILGGVLWFSSLCL